MTVILEYNIRTYHLRPNSYARDMREHFSCSRRAEIYKLGFQAAASIAGNNVVARRRQSVQIIARAHPRLAGNEISDDISCLCVRAQRADEGSTRWEDKRGSEKAATRNIITYEHVARVLARCSSAKMYGVENVVATLTFQREERRRYIMPLVAPAF